MKKIIFRNLVVGTALIAVLLGVGGCVSGINAAGWSGGTVSGDTLYVGTRNGQLASVNITDGSRILSQQVKMTSSSGYLSCACGSSSVPVAIYGNPVVAGDLAYFAGYDGKIYSVFTNSVNGTVRVFFPSAGSPSLKPIVGGIAYNNGAIYFGDSEGYVYALDAVKGDKLWRVAPEGKKKNQKIWATPAVVDNTLYIGLFDNKLYALNVSDGSEKWEFTTKGPIMAAPVINNGTLYIGSCDRNFYALNPADGKEKWHISGTKFFWTEPVIIDNTIYIGNLDGNVYIINAETGAQITKVNLKWDLASRPVRVNNLVIFANIKGVVYSLDTATNQTTQLADFKMDINSALAVADGIINIQTPNLMLQRINASTGALLPAISLKGT
jgi:eukaryotic-like serine/threonine-protein kinase